MLKKGLPKIGENVICRVERITQFAAWVKLEEYDAEGMIHISEVAGKWIRDIREYVKKGKMYVTKVMGVDEKKKFVRLSLRRVTAFERKEKLNEFRAEKRAYSIIKQAAKILKMSEKEFENEIEKILKEYDSLREFLEDVRTGEKIDIEKNFLEKIREIVEKSVKEKVVSIKAEILLKSFEPNGIEIIKSALNELEKKSGGVIKYISAPRYMIEIKTKNPKETEKKLVKLLEGFSKKYGAEYKVID